MSRLTQDGTPEPVSRDQILRRERGQGNIHFSCSADHKQDWQPYLLDPYSWYMCDHTLTTPLPSPYHPLPGMDNKEALVSEAAFFRQAPVFKGLPSSYFGVPNLTRRLTDLLVGRIKAALPNIKWEVRISTPSTLIMVYKRYTWGLS